MCIQIKELFEPDILAFPKLSLPALVTHLFPRSYNLTKFKHNISMYLKNCSPNIELGQLYLDLKSLQCLQHI